jgi:hypothetical protein
VEYVEQFVLKSSHAKTRHSIKARLQESHSGTVAVVAAVGYLSVWLLSSLIFELKYLNSFSS